MTAPASHFLFCLCQPGSAALLKRHLGRRQPELRLAYSRPGLVTFKSPTALPFELRQPSPFARSWGVSLGRASGPEEVVALAAALGERPLVLQVCERDPGGHEGPRADAERESSVMQAQRAIVEAAATASPTQLWAVAQSPRAGELVADVVLAPPGAASGSAEPWLVGAHRHDDWRSPLAGGALVVPADEGAPSRASEKIHQALAWSRLELRPGDRALELGSAPGGMSHALVHRGVEVWGVDPAEMDAELLAYRHPNGARVHHLREPLGALRREELPARIDWLLVDVNLAPQVVLHSLARLVPRLGPRLCGVILTLKLNEPRFVDELDGWLERVARLSMATVRATQLPSNRRELTVIGLTERGHARRLVPAARRQW